MEPRLNGIIFRPLCRQSDVDKTQTCLTLRKTSLAGACWQQASGYCLLCGMVMKMQATKLKAVTVSNLNRFYKFFHWLSQQQIYSKMITKDPIKDPSTP